MDRGFSGGLQSTGSQRVKLQLRQLSMHIHTLCHTVFIFTHDRLISRELYLIFYKSSISGILILFKFYILSLSVSLRLKFVYS